MIPLRFYRDDKNVYYNNPDGITKKMTIAEFESMMEGGGGGDIPEYSDENAGCYLYVNNDGTLAWKRPQDSSKVFVVNTIYDESTDKTVLNKTFSEIKNKIEDGYICFIAGSYDDPFYSMREIISEAYYHETNNYNVVVSSFAGYSIEDGKMYMTNSVYQEVDGVLELAHSDSIPHSPVNAISYTGTRTNSGTADIFTKLIEGYLIRFYNFGAGTNNSEDYLVTGWGNTGTTYYVTLSDGSRWEGTYNATYMQKVTP